LKRRCPRRFSTRSSVYGMAGQVCTRRPGEAVGITLTLVSIGFCALYTVLTQRLMLDDSSLNVVLAQQAAALGFWFFLTGLRQARAPYAGSVVPLIPVFGASGGPLDRGAAGAAAVARTGRHRRGDHGSRVAAASRCATTAPVRQLSG